MNQLRRRIAHAKYDNTNSGDFIHSGTWLPTHYKTPLFIYFQHYNSLPNIVLTILCRTEEAAVMLSRVIRLFSWRYINVMTSEYLYQSILHSWRNPEDNTTKFFHHLLSTIPKTNIHKMFSKYIIKNSTSLILIYHFNTF